MTTLEQYCSGPELRAMLRISRSTYHRLVQQGLPAVGNGRLRRHPVEEALKWYDGADPAETT